ncbi:Sucrose transport protein [Spatholobus suberectus]|nr:Sucrose transport protein [Spatholobus suberectus]
MGKGTIREGKAYDRGMRTSALWLMLNYVALHATSFGVEVLAHQVASVNILLAICSAMTKLAKHSRRYTIFPNGHKEPLLPPGGVNIGMYRIDRIS